MELKLFASKIGKATGKGNSERLLREKGTCSAPRAIGAGSCEK